VLDGSNRRFATDSDYLLVEKKIGLSWLNKKEKRKKKKKKSKQGNKNKEKQAQRK